MASPRGTRRSRTLSTEALAVRIHPYAESSAIVVLLTKDLGLTRAVAKGAKRLSNGFRGPLDKCVLHNVRVSRRAREGLYHLTSASVREAFPRLRSETERFFAANCVIEIAADLMREEEPNEELFRLTTYTLKALDKAPRERIGLAATLFLARAAALSGHAPEIKTCVSCNESLHGELTPYLSPLRGGALHAACGQGEPGARPVAPALLELLAALWRHAPGPILTMDLPAASLRDLRILLEGWLESVLERRFRAAAPMERELARSAKKPRRSVG